MIRGQNDLTAVQGGSALLAVLELILLHLNIYCNSAVNVYMCIYLLKLILNYWLEIMQANVSIILHYLIFQICDVFKPSDLEFHSGLLSDKSVWKWILIVCLFILHFMLFVQSIFLFNIHFFPSSLRFRYFFITTSLT